MMKSFLKPLKSVRALFLAILILGVMWIWHTIVYTDREMRAHLLRQTEALAHSLDLESIQTLSGSAADLNQPEYLRLKDQLAATRTAYPQCRFIYLMGKNSESKLFFFADSEPTESKDCSPAGQIYEEAPAEYGRVFTTHTEAVVGPKTDRWGTWITGLVPLHNSHENHVCHQKPSMGKGNTCGVTRAVLGMDIDARNWNRMLVLAALPTALLTLALTALLWLGTALLVRRTRHDGLPPRWMHHLEPALAITVGAALSVFAAVIAHQRENSNRALAFEQLARDHTEAIADTLRVLHSTELENLARFYESDEKILPKDFQHFTASLAKNPTVQAWEWIPAVPAADLPSFQTQMRSTTGTDFLVWQHDATGKRLPVTPRPVYYPVTQVAPMSGNESALGFDLGSDPLRREALEAAAHSGLNTTTAPVTLVQETGNQTGLLIFRPVFDATEQPRVRGYVLAVLRMGTLLLNARPENPALQQLSLLHKDAPPETLATDWDAANPPHASLSITHPIMAFGKVFAVTSYAGPAFLNLHPANAAWNVALTGLCLTIALAIVISVLLRHREELERLVASRTREIQESETYQRVLLSHLPAGVVIVDPATRLIEQANDFAASLFGAPMEYLIGQRCHSLLCPSEEGSCPVCDLGKTVDNSEREMLRADGTRLAILKTVKRVQLNGQERLLECFVDISERKRAQDALRVTTDRLTLATRAGGVGIWDYDVIHERLVWDNQMFSLYGIAPDRFNGAYEAWKTGLHPDDQQRGDEEIQLALSGQKEFDTEFRVIWPDGSIHNIRALALVQRDASGRALHMIGTNWDITALKQAEAKLLESNKKLEGATERAVEMSRQAHIANIAKSEFLANMSHEIRTPMNGVIGMTDLLLETPLNAEQRRCAEIVRASGAALLNLINDILDFSKIEAGKLDLETLDFDLRSLLANFSALLAPQAEKKGLEFSCDIAPDVPAYVNGDPGRLRQILLNLTSNAIKFTPHGKVAVQVSRVSATPTVTVLRFVVRDSGIGIPSDKQELLFQKFTQVDASIARHFGGSGLGLAISKQLVLLMDGEIGVSSVVGQGSEFWFTVCFAACLHPHIAHLPQAISNKKPRWHGLRILLAEDNLVNQKVARGFLEAFDLQVDVVDDGAQAIQALSTTPYALVIMDMQMPEMDGIEATRLIRSEHSAVLNHQITIVAMTANAMQEDQDKCFEAGMNDYISKPVSSASLASILKKWLPKAMDD